MKTATRLIWIGVVILIGLGLLLGGFWLSRIGWGSFGFGRFGMMGGFGFGGVPMILFWIVMIVLGVWLISSLAPHTNNQPPSNVPPAESALDILQKRYARGEITKEQYEEMRRDLNV